MPSRATWISSSADVERLPADARRARLHRITPEIVAAMNRRPSLRWISLRGEDLDDPQARLVRGIENLDGIDLFRCERISDAGLDSILRIERLRSVSFLSADVSEAALARLHRYPWIESLAFDNTEHVTDAVLEAVGRLPRLQTLYLETWELERDSFRHLERVPSLRKLQVCEDPTSVDHAPLFAHRDLEVLRLYAYGEATTTEEADRVLRRVRALPRLTELVVEGYPASPAALEGIGSLAELRDLSLGPECCVDSRVVRAIARLRELRVLRCSGSTLADDDLRVLATLPRLESMRVER